MRSGTVTFADGAVFLLWPGRNWRLMRAAARAPGCVAQPACVPGAW